MRQFLDRHPKLARLAKELGKFGSVGALAYVVQLSVTNLLWGLTDLPPVAGQLIGTTCAVTVAFVGNRFWTFADRARTGYRRETVLFLVMNGIGALIQVSCLGFAVYILGFDGQLAQNIAGNIVGVGLGTLFRFFSYRTWVFPEQPEQNSGDGESVAAGAGETTGGDRAG